mgnify:CR=1 FL=1
MESIFFIFIISGLDELPAAKQMAARRDVLKRFQNLNIITTDKLKTFPVDTIPDVQSLLRQVVNVKKTLRGHKNRPFLLAETIGIDGDSLKVTGWLSSAMSVNLPVHIPGVGDFLLSRVETESGDLIINANAEKQPNLNPEAEVDMLDAEQTFPTEEEIETAEIKTEVKRRVPKGVSEYQATWLPEEDDEETESEEEDEDFEEMPGLEGEDPPRRYDEEMAEDEHRVRFDENTASENTEDHDKDYDFEEEQRLLRLHRAAKDDREFPDEIDTPEDAKTRFQKFRGLASFRTSPWDVNENLPLEYAKIFKFRRWNHAKIRARKWMPELAETVAAGQCVTLVLRLRDEDKDALKQIADLDSLILFGLLSNEHRMSVMHLVMKRVPGFTAEIANKTKLYFSCGFRRFQAQPIFSQHTNGNKVRGCSSYVTILAKISMIFFFKFFCFFLIKIRKSKIFNFFLIFQNM